MKKATSKKASDPRFYTLVNTCDLCGYEEREYNVPEDEFARAEIAGCWGTVINRTKQHTDLRECIKHLRECIAYHNHDREYQAKPRDWDY